MGRGFEGAGTGIIDRRYDDVGRCRHVRMPDDGCRTLDHARNGNPGPSPASFDLSGFSDPATDHAFSYPHGPTVGRSAGPIDEFRIVRRTRAAAQHQLNVVEDKPDG